jgi:curli biogenesis system outer membrane secretion channel CsgG
MLLFVLLLAWSAVAYGDVPTLAIADLSNNTGDEDFDPAGAGVAAMLITRFSKTDAVQVVERQQLQSVLDELGLSKSGIVSKETALRSGRLVGARYMVFRDALRSNPLHELLRWRESHC